MRMLSCETRFKCDKCGKIVGMKGNADMPPRWSAYRRRKNENDPYTEDVAHYCDQCSTDEPKAADGG